VAYSSNFPVPVDHIFGIYLPLPTEEIHIVHDHNYHGFSSPAYSSACSSTSSTAFSSASGG
jgi:hypothetical protein